MFNEIIIIINIYNYIVIIRQRHFLSVLMDATMTHSSKWLYLFSLKDHTYALLSTALSAFLPLKLPSALDLRGCHFSSRRSQERKSSN